MTLRSEDWPRAKEMFEGARALPADARPAYLDAACGVNQALRQEVELLLASHELAKSFLETPASVLFDDTMVTKDLEGQRIGAYQLSSRIGAGGMGEVYRARDTKLHRDVAIKVLPDLFANDPERLARFREEAQILASLNHPNIGGIYGLEESDPSTGSGLGVMALVLELVEGPTLADRLGKGALPLDQALEVAIEIASALDAAHRAGITHRDLKPGNIMLTKAGAKLLDFGLAKHGAAVAGTRASPLTAHGTILGTLQYMAPEQLEGKEADPRTDIFAFGAVLYEMLTGKKAFEGTSQPLTPRSLDRVVRKCLAKEPDRRWQSASDLRDELKWIAEAPADASAIVAPRRPLWRRVAIPAGAALAAAVVAMVGTAGWLATSTTVPLPMRLSVAPPQNVTLSAALGASIPAVSPDGRRVAFVATRAGVNLLWVRSLDSLEAQPLSGTDGARYPFWSPDSRALGFWGEGSLKTIDASGGPVRTLANASSVRGGTWSPGGVIVIGSLARGLFTVSANGGPLTPLTTPDAAHGEVEHRFPSFLPDGRHFLYWATPSNAILLGSLDSKETTRLLTAESQAVYVAPGSLLFVQNGTLMAQPFDARRGTLTGEAVPIAEQVLPDISGAAAFAASSSGVLAYRTGTLGAPTQLTWVDRAGRPLGAVGPPGRYRNPELSPDGTRLAVETVDPQGRTQDIWLAELARGVVSRFTSDPGNDTYPVWSPDGARIMFASDRDGGVANLYQKRADGVGTDEAVLKSNVSMRPDSWSPDGRFVVLEYRITTASGLTPNLGILALVGERTPHPFEPSRFGQLQGQMSPDGRWLAYASNDSGREEIYVQSFPAPGGGKWTISRDGARFPRWRRDGRELFYYANDGRLMAVSVMGTTGLEVGAAVPLFQAPLLNGATTAAGFRHQYDVSRDGRFLLNVPVEDASPPSITVVVNWEAGLRK